MSIHQIQVSQLVIQIRCAGKIVVRIRNHFVDRILAHTLIKAIIVGHTVHQELNAVFCIGNLYLAFIDQVLHSTVGHGSDCRVRSVDTV